MNKDVANLIINESKKTTPSGVVHGYQISSYDQDIVEQTANYLINNGTISATLSREYTGLWTIFFN